MKPKNQYKKGSVIWAVLEGDWEDLVPVQIAEVLGVKEKTVRRSIERIREETGYDVPRARAKKRSG